MEEFKDRLKAVRKSMPEKMSQAEFGAMLGYKREAYKVYEAGRIKEVPDNFIKLVCRSTGVSESWLRTGEGEMRVSDDAAAFDALARQHNWGKYQRNAARVLMSMSEEDIKACIDGLRRVNKAFAAAWDGWPAASARAPTAEELARAEILREEREAVEKARREAEAKLAALKAGGKTTASSTPPSAESAAPSTSSAADAEAA